MARGRAGRLDRREVLLSAEVRGPHRFVWTVRRDWVDPPFAQDSVDGVVHALSTVPVPDVRKARWGRGGQPQTDNLGHAAQGHHARTSPISGGVSGCPPFAHRCDSFDFGDRRRGRSVDNPTEHRPCQLPQRFRATPKAFLRILVDRTLPRLRRAAFSNGGRCGDRPPRRARCDRPCQLPQGFGRPQGSYGLFRSLLVR